MFILNGDQWISLPLKLPREFAHGGAVHLHGEIYIFGGSMRRETYKLDKETLKWTRLADMIEGRRYISNSCLEWKGSIWVFGGWQSKRVERYDLNTKKWIKMA